MKQIGDFLKALQAAQSTKDDRLTWPLSPVQVSYEVPYLDIEANYFYHTLKKLQKKGIPKREIAFRLPSPTSLRAYLPELVIGSKLAFLSRAQRIWLLCEFFDLLTCKQVGNIFCEGGKNIIWSQEEVKKTLKKINLTIPKDYQLKRAISELSVSLESLTWALFYDTYHTIGVETHGPYSINTDEESDMILVVKDFMNLRPIEIWEHTNEFLFDKISLYLVYKDSSFTVDFFGNTHTLTPDLPSKLVKSGFVIDNSQESMSIRSIKQITSKIERMLLFQRRLVDQLDHKSKIKKFLEIRYFMFKNFREWMGEDWRPSHFIWRRLQEANKLLFDPREDFVM
jgi:hypothetical protein